MSEQQNKADSNDPVELKQIKPMSELKIGLITFAIFIVFMIIWMSFTTVS